MANKSEKTIKEISEESAEKTENVKKSPKEKPEKKTKKLSQLEYEKKILELAQTGLTSEKIGEALRKEDIHPQEYKRKISGILKEKNAYVNPDMKNVENRLERIKAHYSKNKQDKRAMREKDRVFAQFRKLKKYAGVAVK